MRLYNIANLHSAYSIGLYAINLMEKGVPERHAQISDANYRIRRLTPERVALNARGLCPKTGPIKMVSSFLVERSQILDQGFSYPAGVMY